ncbi:CTP synthase [Striga asiatica]|uniref:CTP synthase n=1 Tax=Striga asiatica TaxID=4170 RepID=A0A5A7QZD3_STRAF|nr:CTP synthase [Striga asiatica]
MGTRSPRGEARFRRGWTRFARVDFGGAVEDGEDGADGLAAADDLGGEADGLGDGVGGDDEDDEDFDDAGEGGEAVEDEAGAGLRGVEGKLGEPEEEARGEGPFKGAALGEAELVGEEGEELRLGVEGRDGADVAHGFAGDHARFRVGFRRVAGKTLESHAADLKGESHGEYTMLYIEPFCFTCAKFAKTRRGNVLSMSNETLHSTMKATMNEVRREVMFCSITDILSAIADFTSAASHHPPNSGSEIFSHDAKEVVLNEIRDHRVKSRSNIDKNVLLRFPLHSSRVPIIEHLNHVTHHYCKSGPYKARKN